MKRTFLRAVELIFDAAASPKAWPRAVAGIAAAAGADAALLAFGSNADEVALLATVGIERPPTPLAASTLAAAFVAPLDGSAVGIVAFPAAWGGRLGAGADEALAALGLQGRRGGAAGVSLTREGGAVGALWLFPIPGARLEGEGLEALQDLVPHLARALAVHGRVELAERRAAEAADAFDRVALAAVVVDSEARPILANRAARRISAQQDGFMIGENGLRGATPADTRMLHAAVAEVARRGSGPGLGLRLSRVSSSRPYEVMAVPIGRGRRWPALRSRGAVVFVSDAGVPHVSPEQLVRDLYVLTGAETRLAVLLLGGQSLPEAAAILGISRNTAHTQLAGIFRKTGTGSQAELVRVLLSGPGAVRLPGDSSDAYPQAEVER